MYFLVSFKNENEMICSNIVIADSKEEAEAACSEYEWVRAEPATDAVLQWAANSGVPIMSAKEKKIRDSANAHHNAVAKEMVENQDIIVAERLNVSGMRKNHCLSKSISDAGWHSFLTVLSQKAAMYGKTFVTADPRNTTQTCSACGHVLKGDKKLTLSDREWTCPNCGTHHSRDANAAVNILKRYMDTQQKEQQ